MPTNPYETAVLLNQYLLFHYGTAGQQYPHAEGPRYGLHFPVRCVTQCLDVAKLGHRDRALDLGCSVGRASFQLSLFFKEVIGVDLSKPFIEAAKAIQANGKINCQIQMEGIQTKETELLLDPHIPRDKVKFIVGDALNPDPDWGTFDCVFASNLLDRVPNPELLLRNLMKMVRPEGEIVLISPYTWLEEYTPKDKWPQVPTFDFISSTLGEDFDLHLRKNLPFLIREHSRKYQFGTAEASVWLRKDPNAPSPTVNVVEEPDPQIEAEPKDPV